MSNRKNLPPYPEVETANPFDNKPELLTDPVFLIGNGASRKNFDLERLRKHGTIIGCNALYRDFKPDILVAIDQKMLLELNKAGYCNDNECFIPGNRNTQLKNAMRYKFKEFNTSGCFAIKMIGLLMKPTTCYLIGMDGFPGNIYDNTTNYSTNTLKCFKGIKNHYLKALEIPEINTKFINVNEQDAWPQEAHDTGKYSFMTFEEFDKIIGPVPQLAEGTGLDSV